MSKKICFLLTICLVVVSFSLKAQDREIGQGKEYTIGGIEVSGATSYNENTIITFTGLHEGQKIFIPGDKISEVIKKLWDLKLFNNVNLYVTDMKDDKVFLELEVEEVPELRDVEVKGLKNEKKGKKLAKEFDLKEGTKVTDNLIADTRKKIKEKYSDDGFMNAEVAIDTKEVNDTSASGKQQVDMLVDVNKGQKVKIKTINIKGNDVFSDGKVRRQMKTKPKNFLRFWKRSKFVRDQYEEDKEDIIKKYKSRGYRDARIVSDSIKKLDEKNIAIDLKVNEGEEYYFGNISFLGNNKYDSEDLRKVLKFKKGDVYNGTLLEESIEDTEDPDADDITNLYQNNGYLFSQINPVETRVYNDTIDFEVRIQEGKIAHYNKVNITGNDKTNDHVIYRDLRTRPGQQYSKQDVVRSVRELGQLGFFDAENLEPEFENVDPNNGTLDLHYDVTETGSSQIELQGGYGGGGFVGTIGLSFNNFSIKNIFNGEAYKPLPTGDGQTLSLRAQAASYYQTYSLSFEEPWLGGKKPIRLTTSFQHTRQNYYDAFNRHTDHSREFLITGGSVGLSKRLQWPDDFFTISGSLSYNYYKMRNYNIGLFNFPRGHSNNLAITLGINRDNTHTNPIFPTGGSKFDITAKFTPPYSLFNGMDYEGMEDDPEYQKPNGDPDDAKIDQKRFNWLEYYKLKFEGDWYNKLIGDLVLRTNLEFGFMGAYNSDRGTPPFERFYLGGDGMQNYALDDRENIRLRGYPNQSLTPRERENRRSGGADRNDGATIYDKYSLELRYPITLKPQASIFGLAFAEGGASFDHFQDFDPFEINRSAGIGIRIFMPQFGLLGIDFGYGFDPIPGTNGGANGWETHFIIGQNF